MLLIWKIHFRNSWMKLYWMKFIGFKHFIYVPALIRIFFSLQVLYFVLIHFIFFFFVCSWFSLTTFLVRFLRAFVSFPSFSVLLLAFYVSHCFENHIRIFVHKYVPFSRSSIRKFSSLWSRVRSRSRFLSC